MPYKRKYGKKRTYKRRRRVGKRTRKMARINKVGSAIVPNAMYTKLRFMQRITMTSTTGTAATKIYRGNSVYDPDYSVGGDSALGFDIYASIYRRYRVYASKITVKTLLDPELSATSGYEFGIIPVNDGFGSGPTPEEISMNARGKFTLVGTEGGGSKGYMKHYATTSSIQGKRKLAIALDDETSSTTSGNPNDVWYWILSARSADHSATNVVYAYVSITYYVKFEDRNPINSP